MTEQSNGIKLSAAVVSDRGLSKKRPLNEDSFLSDPERRIFAVADGVGGAQAGEVASQTAMEVLDEAFRHIEPGADVEDLLEIAIQRANSSINSMSREHPKLSMMATTVVALHLDGRIATIGHVGDSRLYSLTPDGQLHRETADHSVVEEEVRAGRMTPEQASNHPSRNVISRALGAEETVEVDLKTKEVEDGTTFLLCSDGITRHIPDTEIRELLTSGPDLNTICEEMKRRCYDRGAEDNLTAVIVRVGDPVQFAAIDDERTIVTERPQLAATMSGEYILPQDVLSADAASDSELHDTVEVPTRSGPVRPFAPKPAEAVAASAPVPLPLPPPKRRSAFKSLLRAIAFLILLGVVGAAAFFGGAYYQEQKQKLSGAQPATPSTTQNADQPAQQNQPSAFEQERTHVDKDPKDWIEKVALPRVNSDNKPPTKIDDAQFLYLYGRALYLTRDYKEALKAFNNALSKLDQQSSSEVSPLRVETLYGKIAAAGKIPNYPEVNSAYQALDGLSVKKDELPQKQSGAIPVR